MPASGAGAIGRILRGNIAGADVARHLGEGRNLALGQVGLGLSHIGALFIIDIERRAGAEQDQRAEGEATAVGHAGSIAQSLAGTKELTRPDPSVMQNAQTG